ncbi:MAG: Ig-like domain-containing protein, partial [Verrucomicrobia bacterium]|nr:Ig-like domain-containing protein [Verrucomicrobiota bacterium]
MKTNPISKAILAIISAGLSLVASASAVTIGFGTALTGGQDTQSDGTTNQMRQNINITDTVFLDPGTYQATTWDYQAAVDATNGATQPVFPFLTIVNGPANHTVVAFGETIDTEPGIQTVVPFGGTNNTFVIPAGGATVAAGIQNTNAPGVQNSILTDTSFGNTDHANSLNVDEAGAVGATLDSFGHANLARTYAFSIEVEPVDDPNPTPPVITSLGPADGATEVAVGSSLVATFDEPICTDPSNITIKNLTDATQIAIPVGDPQVSISGVILTIDPTALLEADKDYAIQIDATAIEDSTGDNFAGIADDTTWNFSTAAPDLIAPSITTLSPASGAANVTVSRNLVATFDEPISIGSGDITIKNLTDATQIVIPVGDPQVSVVGAVLTIDPTADLDLAKIYAIQIGATAIEDGAENPFAGIGDDTTWTFSTPVPVSGAITIGFGTELNGVQDTQSDGATNQMRQNINITDTVILDAGTYQAITWDYQAGPDATNGATQPVFPFLTIVNGPADHTVLAFGETHDTEPGIQT